MRSVITLAAGILAATVSLSIVACNTTAPLVTTVVPKTKAAQDIAKVIAVADNAQDAIGKVCAVLAPLAPMAPPIAPYILGACAGDAVAAKIALDPSTDDWFLGLANQIGK